MPITPNRPNWPTGTPGGPQPAGQPRGPAITLGQQQFNYGSGLLNSPVAGSGVGQVAMPQGPSMPTSRVAPNSFGSGVGGPMAPDRGTGYGMDRIGGRMPTLNTDTSTNPWLRQQGRGIMNQTNQMLGQNLMSLQGNAVASGGLGGSRQGVAQGLAMGQAADHLSSNLANLYGAAHESQQDRNMQQYGMENDRFLGMRGQDVQRYGIDSNSYLGQRGQDITMRGQDLQNYNQGMDRGLQQYQADQQFWTQQRGQDLAQVGLGSGLINQGLNTQWLPMQNASEVYGRFAGNGTTTDTSSSGGGWMGALGGAAGIYQMGNAGGWW